MAPQCRAARRGRSDAGVSAAAASARHQKRGRVLRVSKTRKWRLRALDADTLSRHPQTACEPRKQPPAATPPSMSAALVQLLVRPLARCCRWPRTAGASASPTRRVRVPVARTCRPTAWRRASWCRWVATFSPRAAGAPPTLRPPRATCTAALRRWRRWLPCMPPGSSRCRACGRRLLRTPWLPAMSSTAPLCAGRRVSAHRRGRSGSGDAALWCRSTISALTEPKVPAARSAPACPTAHALRALPCRSRTTSSARRCLQRWPSWSPCRRGPTRQGARQPMSPPPRTSRRSPAAPTRAKWLPSCTCCSRPPPRSGRTAGRPARAPHASPRQEDPVADQLLAAAAATLPAAVGHGFLLEAFRRRVSLPPVRLHGAAAAASASRERPLRAGSRLRRRARSPSQRCTPSGYVPRSSRKSRTIAAFPQRWCVDDAKSTAAAMDRLVRFLAPQTALEELERYGRFARSAHGRQTRRTASSGRTPRTGPRCQRSFRFCSARGPRAQVPFGPPSLGGGGV
jgi:hypothetical protein